MKNLLHISIMLIMFFTLTYAQNYSLYFDGTNDYVKTSQVAAVSNNFTMEFWAKPTTEDLIVNEGVTNGIGERMVLHPPHGTSNWESGHAGVGITVATNTITVNEMAANYLISTLVWVGTITGWNHIAVVYENKTPRLYVNGILVHTGITSSYNYIHPSLGYDGDPFHTNNNGIGTGMGGGHYKGYLDEMRISNNIRYSSNFMPLKSFSNDGNTIGLFHFNEGSGIVTNDVSALSNNGTIYGATWSTDVPGSQPSPNYSLKLNWNLATVQEYIEVPFSTSINSYFASQKLTISLWYKPLGNHTGWNWYLRKSIGGCQDDFAFGHSTHQPGDYSYLLFGNARSCTGDQYLEDFTTGIQVGQWNHLEVNLDASIGKARIFINGLLKVEANNFSNITANQIVTYILFGMNGLADELHFSNSIRHVQNFVPQSEEIADQNTIFLLK